MTDAAMRERSERTPQADAADAAPTVRHHFTSISLHGVPTLRAAYAPYTDTHSLTFGTSGAWISFIAEGPEEATALAAALEQAAFELRSRLD